MNQKDTIFFYLQYLIGRITVFITLPLIVLAVKCAGYRIKQVNRVRKQVKTMMTHHPGPWLICPNHLTMIDSVILAYALVPPRQYLFQYRRLPWNVPELTKFKGNLFVVVICFLMKCIPLVRGGDRKALKSVFSKCSHLLEKKENLIIFPEGTRSRTGRVKKKGFPYGAGRFFLSVPAVRVMCVYLRGENQAGYSALPRYGEAFYLSLKQAVLSTPFKGLRAQRDLSGQIIAELSQMEEEYFASCGK